MATGWFNETIDSGNQALQSWGGADIFVAAFAADGSNTWTEGFGDSEDWQYGRCIAMDDQGNAIVGGDFYGTVDFGSGPLVSQGREDIFLVKFGADVAPHRDQGPIVTGVTAEIPAPTFQLGQNAPNPFNPTTTIPIEVPEKSMATLVVYDVAGRVVRTLLDEVVPPGRKELVWDGTDSGGNSVTSGVYFCRLAAGGRRMTRKLVLLK